MLRVFSKNEYREQKRKSKTKTKVDYRKAELKYNYQRKKSTKIDSAQIFLFKKRVAQKLVEPIKQYQEPHQEFVFKKQKGVKEGKNHLIDNFFYKIEVTKRIWLMNEQKRLRWKLKGKLRKITKPTH